MLALVHAGIYGRTSHPGESIGAGGAGRCATTDGFAIKPETRPGS